MKVYLTYWESSQNETVLTQNQVSNASIEHVVLPFMSGKKGYGLLIRWRFISKLSVTLTFRKAKCVTLIPFNFLNDFGDEPNVEK